MKKMVMFVMIIVAVVAMMTGACANDESYLKAYNDLNDYMKENDLYGLYHDHLDESSGIYKSYGTLNIESYASAYNVDYVYEDLNTWITNCYINQLEKHFPEYGKIYAFITKICDYNGTGIYRMIVITQKDLVYFVDGDQHATDMLITFG